MITALKEKLWAYIVSNNPDVMFNLQDEYKVIHFLEQRVSDVMPTALRLLEEGKPGHAIHELCLQEMTKDLKPSRYHYILTILSEEYESLYAKLREEGTLTYEAVNLVEYCNAVFDELHFGEGNKDHWHIREAVKGTVYVYFENKEKSSKV